MTSATIARETRDWRLFADWCESLDLTPLPTTERAVADFLAAFPAPIETQGRRVKTIRKAHARAGAALSLPTTERPSVLRIGAQWAAVPRALAQLPTYRHPKGFHVALRGRRDGWLIVLVGVLGLTRRQARELDQSEIRLFPQLSICGQPVPRADTPGECPACAVTRWLRVAGAASFGWRGEIKEIVSPVGVEESAHDCTIGLDGSWRQAATLLPAIDQHGGVSADAMTTRAISATMAFRQTLGEAGAPSRRQPHVLSGRFANSTMSELADAYDDVDQRAAALLLRLKEIVGEADDMLTHIKSFDL